MRYASKQSEITKEIVQCHLGDVFYRIRFRSVTLSELASLMPFFSGIYFRLKNTKTFFNCLKMTNSYQHCSLDLRGSKDLDMKLMNRMRFIAIAGLVTFTTNKPFNLSTIYFSGLQSDEDVRWPHNINVTIQQCDPPHVLFFRNKVDSYVNKQILPLRRPVLIRADTEYEIKVQLDIADHTYFTTELMESLVQIRENNIVRFANYNSLSNGIKMGLIRGLRFNLID